MAIYKLRFDRFNFMTFDISSAELRSKLGSDYRLLLNEKTWQPFWVKVNANFFDDSDKNNVTTIPDITCWFTDRLILNLKAHKELSEKLKDYGEFLEAECEGIKYYIFNVTKIISDDAVDKNQSERMIEGSGFVDVKKLVFNNEKTKDLLLFKTEYTGLKNIYCNDEFKTMVEKSGLHGLLFETDLASIL